MGNGFVRNNINQFAVVYRFVDFLIIQLTLLAACNLYGVPIDVHYHLLGLIGSTTYLLSAELFWLYRSWRSGTSKELIFYTVVSWCFPISSCLKRLTTIPALRCQHGLSLPLFSCAPGVCLCGHFCIMCARRALTAALLALLV